MSERSARGWSVALAAAAALAIFTPSALAGSSDPNDPYFASGQQWSLNGAAAGIKAPSAWCVTTGAGILVGDVDTGADFGHPDLAGKLTAGAAFLGGSGRQTGGGRAAVSDDNGHGTMTTGLVVADTDNGIGIAGVAPSAHALIVKVLDRNGSGYDSDVAAGIEWAVDHGARVINLSIGSDVPLTGDFGNIPSAIDYAYRHGAAVAVAAGNNDLPLTDYQVSQIAREALVVGALGPTGRVAYYSTNGVGVNIYAPGGDDAYGSNTKGEVVSTHTGKTGYAVGEGTSFAAPQAAGVLALLMARGMTNVQARQRVLDTADDRNGVPELDAAAAIGSTRLCPSSAAQHAVAAPPAVVTLDASSNGAARSQPAVHATPRPTASSALEGSSTKASPRPAATRSASSLRAAAGTGRSPRARPWPLLIAAVGIVACATALAALAVARR
jgi:subtilisin family serine protease